MRVRAEGLLQQATFWVVLHWLTGGGCGGGPLGAPITPMERAEMAEMMNAAFIFEDWR